MLSATLKFKQLRHFGLVAVLAAAGCAAVAPHPSRVRPTQPLARLTVATSDLDHDLLAQLLAGEMALADNHLALASTHYGQAMALSADPEVAQRAVQLAVASGDTDAARRGLARWQALGAAPAALIQARAELALRQGDTAGAKVQLEKLLGTGGKDVWRRFGRVLLGARDPAQAAQLLQELAVPERLPAEPQAWLAMSELGDKLGRQPYARRIADAAAERFHSAETYTWAAQMRARSGDRGGARALLEKALRQSPDDIRLRLGYAGMLSQEGRSAEAAKILARGPQSIDTYTLRAALAARMQDHKAIARLYRQLQGAPLSVRRQADFLLGQLAEMQGLRERALAWYDRVGDEDDHAFDADLRSALLMHALGRKEQAHDLLQQLQTAYLDQPEALRHAYEADAELYMREARYGQAETAFGRALQVVPDDPALLYGRGLAFAEAGKVDQAVKDLRRLLELKPHDVDASNALGYTLADANRDLGEARRLIEAARTAKPHDPAIADSWGWLQYRLGQPRPGGAGIADCLGAAQGRRRGCAPG